MKFTVVITNYRRPQNIDRIVANLPPEATLFLLDNTNGRHALAEDTLRRADWILTSSKNNLLTRWYMASQAITPYYCVHDDDLMLPTKSYTAYLRHMEESHNIAHKLATGPFGVLLSESLVYDKSTHTARHDDEVDIIKGRLIFGQTAYLQQIALCPPLYDGLDYETVISEDIFTCAAFAKAYHTRLRITNFGDVIELPAPHASSSTSTHYTRRNNASQKAFSFLNTFTPQPISVE